MRKQSAMRRLAGFVAFLAALWMGLYCLDRALPYVHPGSEVIAAAKLSLARSGAFFDAWDGAKDKPRIVILGNSQALTGFDPALFDSLSASRVISMNMGVPGDPNYLPILEKMIETGRIPTHILLPLQWTSRQLPGRYSWLLNDAKVRETFFPFHSLPRDLVLFALNSRAHGGMRQLYNYTKQEAEQMVGDRGYYFIAGQSHFPNDQLPASFSLPGDAPELPDFPRELCIDCEAFRRLRHLLDKHHIKAYLMPAYVRRSFAAPAPEKNETAMRLLSPYPQFRILGPDYFTYPNEYFSDEKHLNRHGAAAYTEALWKLFEKELAQPPVPQPGEIHPDAL